MSIPYPVTVDVLYMTFLIKKIESVAIDRKAPHPQLVVTMDSSDHTCIAFDSLEECEQALQHVKDAIVMAWRSGE